MDRLWFFESMGIDRRTGRFKLHRNYYQTPTAPGAGERSFSAQIVRPSATDISGPRSEFVQTLRSTDSIAVHFAILTFHPQQQFRLRVLPLPPLC